MSANSYVMRLARNAVIRSLEKVNIRRSLAILQEKVDAHFNDGSSSSGAIDEHFPFGSFTRGTMLPRSMDPQSDVDYMIVFADSDSKPQAYLDRLRRFAEKRYQSYEIAQSHPTIILSMNHIRFELVPAIKSFWSGIQIPSKGSLFSEWMTTTPHDLNGDLTAKNKSNDSLIKPLIRLVKYWNACNNYPFESFSLEQLIVNHWKLLITVLGANLWRRFCAFINELDVDAWESNHQKSSIQRAQGIIADVKRLESHHHDAEVERELRRLLPEISHFK